MQLLTVNGAIICDDVVKHRSLTTAGNWDEFPVVLDIRLMENYVLLLGDDKMVHIVIKKALLCSDMRIGLWLLAPSKVEVHGWSSSVEVRG